LGQSPSEVSLQNKIYYFGYFAIDLLVNLIILCIFFLFRKISMPKPVIRAIPVEPLDVKFNEECEKEINVDNWTEINQE